MAHARGLSDQWYIGFGGTVAALQPNPEAPGNNVDDSVGTGGTFYFGKDINERSSVQLQAVSLGDATLDDGEVISFNSVDASLLYRFFDSRDNNFGNSALGVTFYGRFALGFLDRDTELDLDQDSAVFFGAGAGLEFHLANNVAIRTEGFFNDIDAASASVGLVFRFGSASGSRSRLIPGTLNGPRAPASITKAPTNPTVPTVPVIPTVPEVTSEPVVPPITSSLVDADNDGVEDSKDLCAASTPGYPVRSDGCALFDGVLSGIRFEPGSVEIADGSEVQLRFLVDLLVNNYPDTRIELHSHTDNEGDVRSQAILTRGRLRTVGTYLVNRGVRANRLVLRSFGGSRPLFDNVSQEGRDSNNRIEVLERPR